MGVQLEKDFVELAMELEEDPALMAWPTSWKVQDRGSQSKIKGAARNCSSSLTNIFDVKRQLKA